MLAINKERVQMLLEGLAQFGRNEQGITRLAYTETDKQAQEWLLQQIEDLQLEIRQDAVGNVFLRRTGENPALPAVATGSHLDTVIHGGAYDGMCGVAGALEALHMLADEKLQRSIDVIIFRAEESSRFGFATIGSKLLTGSAVPAMFDKAARKGDVTFTQALQQCLCKGALSGGCIAAGIL